ncbi:MAG: hypothetical protein OHK0046_41130 [Anaerolineae bacterium]
MMAVFRKALRDSRRTILWLSIGLAVYAIMILGFYPSILANQEQFDQIIESYPPELMAFFLNGVDVEEFSFANPDNFLQVYFGTWMVLIVGGMITYQAFNAVTNAERNGTMDVMMSFPVSRREMLLGRFLNTMVTILAVLTACFVVFFIGTLVIEGFEVGVVDLALAIYSAFLILIAQAMFTYMLAAIFPSSSRWLGAAAYALFFGSYLIFGFAGISETVDRLSPLLLFNYYDAGEIIRNGVDLVNWLVLGGVAVVFGAAALWGIERKQLGV